MILAFDQFVQGRPYPNIARHQARPYTPAWRQFDHHWPYVVPLRLTMYLDHAGISYQCVSTKSVQTFAWYPINFGWFDFSIDYFNEIPLDSLNLVKNNKMGIMFYYHEGDNPQRILNRLEELSATHNVNMSNVILISANSSANDISKCVYFDDLECFLRYVNREQRPDVNQTMLGNRPYEFTCLSRHHKWWRASVVADLHRCGILDQSLWSYRTNMPAHDKPEDNPISLVEFPGLENYVHEFLSHDPYTCDDVNLTQQRDFHLVNDQLHYESYWNIVIETHFDADQSGGTFLTEKTWKPIKYGQPFVLIAPTGSLQELRNKGYRVFDHVIDNSYDTIVDNTKRWQAVSDIIADIKRQGVEQLWVQCHADILHNMKLFESRKAVALNTLLERITCNQ